MKKFFLLFLFLYSAALVTESYSQTRPTLQITGGLAFPGNSFAGELVTVDDSGITNISSDFIKNNYAASTGATISGALKFPITSSGVIGGVLTGSYTFFNAFRRSYLGNTIINGISIPVNTDNRFSTSTIAFGIEASPVPGSKISPFINANLSLNILSLTLSENDYATVIFNDAFRMGVLANAGINYNINQEYTFIINGSYHMSNLLFKSSNDSYADRIGYNRESVPINDEEGRFYSNLSDPDEVPVLVNGQTKNVDWWGINLGLSIVLGKSKK